MNSQHTPVLIIGAGPGGITAAVQLQRYGIDFIIMEANEVGGLLRNANFVENYPGFPKGISGHDLVKLMRAHLTHLDISVAHEMVTHVTLENKIFTALTGSGATITADYCIIASGTIPRKLEKDAIIGIDSCADRLFSEIVELGPVQNETIVIIGGGDAAFDYALNLSQQNKVVILCRNKNPQCVPLLSSRALMDESISYLSSAQITSFTCTSSDIEISYAIGSLGPPQVIHANRIIAAIGRDPAISFLGPKLTKCFTVNDTAPNLFFVGDVIRGIHRQASIAVGDGMHAAMKIAGILEQRS